MTYRIRGTVMLHQLRSNRTLWELIAGAVMYCAFFEIPLLIFTQRRLYHSMGLAAGLIVCILVAANMADTIDIAVDLDEKSAKAYLQKKSSLRYLVICGALLAVQFLKLGNPLTYIAGIMGLKIGAYLQPFTHKVTEKIIHKEGETSDG